jgi:hypothetical protein
MRISTLVREGKSLRCEAKGWRMGARNSSTLQGESANRLWKELCKNAAGRIFSNHNALIINIERVKAVNFAEK